MPRSLQAACGLLLLTAIWTGCSSKPHERGQPQAAAPANQAAAVPQMTVHEPEPVFMPGAPAPEEPSTQYILPQFSPEPPPPEAVTDTKPAETAPVEAPHITKHPDLAPSLEEMKKSFLLPGETLPSPGSNAPPVKSNREGTASDQVVQAPAEASAPEPDRFPIVPNDLRNALRPPRIPSGSTRTVDSPDTGLPPIMSPDSLPRKGNSTAPRMAIADSSPRPFTPKKQQDPSGGSAPLSPSQRHAIRNTPDITMKMEVESEEPPIPLLAEPPPQMVPIEQPSGTPSAPQRFVPPVVASGPSIAPEELPPALQGGGSPAPNTQINSLFTPASQRIKGDREVVEVFYGTDRYPDNACGEAPNIIVWRFLPAIFTSALATVLVGLSFRWPNWKLYVSTTMIGAIALGLAWYAGDVTTTNARELAKQGPRYGVERGELQTGICRVSIPHDHKVGALEAPSIIKLEVQEDVRKHVVLEEVRALPTDDFHKRLQARVAKSERHELFIFIHGYNVSFEDAARRTAQMQFDLDYQGAPIFYSWPSQNELWKYTVDETNVAWTTPHFKDFLRDVAKNSGAKSINLIAHSMGNRALTSALRDISLEMRDEEKLFNQVVLAAPDIDAEVFTRDIAPKIVKTAENVTLYASSHDQALVASKLVHGYPRAGESGRNLVVYNGIDTIDVSQVETNFLGHTYYGDSDVILADVCRLLTNAERPAQRQWLTPMPSKNMTYWVFQGARAAASMPKALR